MANIVIAGNAAVVKSALKLEDIALIQKYRPNELTLKGGEDGKEPIFTLGIAPEGCGSVGTYGVSFDSATRDDEKLACTTMMISGVTGDISDWVVEQFGGAMTNLNKLEARLPAVIAEIHEEQDAVKANISVVQ